MLINLFLILTENSWFREDPYNEKRMAEAGETRCAHPQKATVSGTSNDLSEYELQNGYNVWYILMEHQLHLSCFQLCYVDSGIASSEEMSQFKAIDSTLIRL
jgi:hypothetical protein